MFDGKAFLSDSPKPVGCENKGDSGFFGGIAVSGGIPHIYGVVKVVALYDKADIVRFAVPLAPIRSCLL